MIKKLLFILTVLGSLTMVFGFNYGTNTSIQIEFLKKFKEANKEMKSIQSDFTQKHFMQIMEEPIVSTGVFYYRKPDLMKWDQRTPSPYYFIVTGNKVVKFDGKKRKELSANNPQVSYFKNFIMGTVDGSLFESKQFDAMYEKSGGFYHVTLSPKEKNMKKRIENILLDFNETSLALVQLELVEAGGDRMVISFTDQQFNSIIDNSVFK